MNRRNRVLLSLVLVGAAGAALAAGPSGADQQSGQPGQGDQPAPTFRSSVNAVQVSVIVTDANGRPVSGLTQDDFEIIENKQSVPISTFLPVNIPIEAAEPVAAVERDVKGNDGPQGRLYLIALDTMPADMALRTRRILRDFIEKHFGPNDTAAVVLTTGGLRDSGQEFTSNRSLLLKAIDKFDGGVDSGGGREKNFMGDFRALMEFMATLQGARKAVIFASQNIPGDPYMIIDKTTRLSGIFSDIHPDFVEALSLATRNNIAIYPIDPGGLTTDLSEAGSNDTSEMDRRSNLRGLAQITGGFALVGSNNYEAAFERLVEENSTYYVIGFNSAEERRSNYSQVQVRVKRPGLTVRTVDGYITPRKPAQAPKRPTTVMAAAWDAVASAITTSGVPMRANATSFKGRGKDASVAVSLEIAANKINLTDDNGIHRGEMDILFAITDSKGKRHPITRHRAKLALSEATFERVSRSALRVVSELKLPKGHYQIRSSAGGAAIAGSVVYDLEIPDYSEDFIMSGVALSSSATAQTLTVSPQVIDVPFPGPPTTVREFAREDRVTLYAEVYENRKKSHSVNMKVELRDATGRVVGTHSVDREAKDKPKDVSSYVFAPTLSLEDVPAGEYVIHVEARSSLDRNRPQQRDIPIKVR